MKNQWKGFLSGILVSVLLVGMVGTAVATVGQRTVNVDYNDIKVTLNGATVNLVDANGAAVEPFSINGTTYLPVRAVASALGLDVEWDSTTKTVRLAHNNEVTPSVSKPEPNTMTTGQKNALKSAESYLSFMAFSYSGLVKQLEYEKYSHEDATFAADHCGADWNEQAAKSATSYLSFSAFSRDGLIKQLEYEGFTHEQAVYGAAANGY